MELNTALSASQQIVRRLLEAMPGAVLVVAADGAITQANTEAIQLLGLRHNVASDRFEPGEVREYFRDDGSPWPIAECPVSRCLATGQAQESETIGMRLPDGSMRWGICTAVPLFDEATGQVTGAVATTVDITGRKQAEQRLAATCEQLTVSHAERGSALAAADAALRTALAEREQAVQANERHLFELQLLNRVGTVCSQARTADEVLQGVTRQIAESLVPDNCGFLLLDTSRKVLKPHGSFVITDPEVEKSDIPLMVGVTGRTARTGQSQRIGDVAQEQDYLASDARTRSELCLPVRFGGKVVGVLNLESKFPQAFSLADERLMAAIADAVGNALERLRAEDALAETQRRLSMILAGADVGVWDWDLSTNAVVFSREWKSQLGYAEHEIADHFDEWKSRVHPSDLTPTLDGVQRTISRRSPIYDVEFRMRHKDGSWRSIFSRGFLLQGADGKPARMCGVHLDITNRKRQEESIKRSEARLSAVLESSNDAIWSVDSEQRLTFCNSTFLELFQKIFDKTPQTGQKPHDLLPPRLAEHWSRQLDRALSGEAYSVTEQYRVLGDPRDFHVLLSPITVDGRVSGVTLISRDVTDLKRALADLEEKRARLEEEQAINQSVLASISDGVVVSNSQGEFTVFNPAASHILGIGRLEGPPEDWPQLYGLYQADGETPCVAEDLPLLRAMRGEFVDNAELLVRRDDLPADVWVSVNARPLVDAQGVRRGGVAAFRDVTEDKRAREAIEADREFKRRMLQAHERDRKLTSLELHDGLVQDISAAKLYVEALQVQYAATPLSNRDAFNKTVKTLRRAVEEGRRIMSGLCPPVMEEFGVVAGIEFLVEDIQNDCATRVTFEHDVHFRRLDLLLESTIFRITQEALNNVRRHSQAPTAKVTLNQHEDSVRLEIRDSGVGFDLSRVPIDRYGVHGIAERAKLFSGSCSIESAPGRGTRILVELPIRPSTSVPLTPSTV